jgi:uncharacterized cupredoxin-like copper-binding protein
MRRSTVGGWLVAGGVAVALGVTGAGVGTAAQGVQTKTLRANPNGELKFNKTKLKASPGKVTVVMKNPASSGIKHGIEVEGNGKEKRGKVVKPGKASHVTLTLKAGTYDYYCPVAGHKQAGMKGKLVVK